ncbi:MAG: hypothetical protein JO257_12735 [Deltaproteobacteria bacterium]|nr:hypothetical protein [Deltaproteobacteria bacterium]
MEGGGDGIASARALTAPPRAALLALVPLLVIVLGFITPPILPHALYHYPARVIPISPWSDGASWMWSIQVVALALALITLADAQRRSVPGIAARVVAVVGILAVLHLPAVMLYVVRGELLSLSAASALVIVATAALVVTSFRRDGWAGWLAMLAAYAVAALPYACPLFAGIFNEFCGGITFDAADVTLLALCALALRRR